MPLDYKNYPNIYVQGATLKQCVHHAMVFFEFLTLELPLLYAHSH